MKLVFDKAKEDYDSKDFDYVKAKITKSLEGLTVSERKVALATLRRICNMFDVDTSVTQKADFTRIMTGASYWSYLTMAFAMTMMFDETSRKGRWAEVEEISALPIGDLAKISNFFDSVNVQNE
ncbi:MAG: hypothetical protein OK455_10835 [Thaumarchaeota archaeon]|nr:hypothetical protein [Nitrososphaerota archaeon]